MSDLIESSDWWRGLGHNEKVEMMEKHDIYNPTEKAIRQMYREEKQLV